MNNGKTQINTFYTLPSQQKNKESPHSENQKEKHLKVQGILHGTELLMLKLLIMCFKKKKLATTTPIRNALRDTAHSQTVGNNLKKK